MDTKTRELTGILNKLISFKTVTFNNDENKRAINWVEQELKGLPLHIKQYDINGFPSLVATTQNTKNPKVWLTAHLDVVDGSDELFNAKEEGGKLYGRGVYDMKFAAACYVHLCKELGKDLENYDVGLMFTSDEEIGGFDGTNALLEEGGYGGELCIIPDGGYNWNFEETAKGVFVVSIQAKGVSGHSSRPWEADNAIYNLIKFIDAVKKDPTLKTGKTGEGKQSKITVSVTQISAGESINQIPDRAQATLDIRFMPDFSKKDVMNIVQKYVDKFKNIEAEEILSADSYSVDVHDDYFQEFKKIAEDMFNIKTGKGTSHGSSDARFFIEKGVAPMVIAPKGGGHHGEKEWIDLEDLEKFYEVLKSFIKNKAV